jgi:hypothetical protein
MKQIRDLEQELNWFSRVLEARIKDYFSEKRQNVDVTMLPPPGLNGSASAYGSFVQKHRLEPAERLVLILSLVPHVKPNLLDIFFTKNNRFDRGFTEFGGLRGDSYSGFLPTGETALFLLAGDVLDKRIAYASLFHPGHLFSRESVISFARLAPGEPVMSAQLELSQEYVHLFTTGEPYTPAFSTQFPARILTTPLQWNDLVLTPDTLEPVMEVIFLAQERQNAEGPVGRKPAPEKGIPSLVLWTAGHRKNPDGQPVGQSCGHRCVPH